MKNFVQPGEVLTVPVSADVVSGQLIFVGLLAGVAACNAKSGTSVEARVEGVFELPKTAGLALAVGAAAKATAAGVIDAAGTVTVGYVTEAAAAPATTVKVRLVPSV